MSVAKVVEMPLKISQARKEIIERETGRELKKEGLEVCGTFPATLDWMTRLM